MEHVCLKIRSQTALNDMQMLLCLYPEIGNGCFGKRIFEWIQDVFGRGCGQGCRKWCLQSCPMEVLGRLKFSILHFQGSGGEEKGGRKGVRGGSERGQNLCVQKVVEKIMLKYRLCLYYMYALGCFGNSRVPDGLVPIIDVCGQKVVKKRWKTQIFVKSRFLLGCDRLLPFFI